MEGVPTKILGRATLNLTNHIIISVSRFAWKSKAHPLWGECTMTRKARQAGYIKTLLPRRHFQHQHQLLNDQRPFFLLLYLFCVFFFFCVCFTCNKKKFKKKFKKRPNKSSQFCLDSSAIRPLSLCVYVRS